MKKTLLIMVMALAVLLTQCRKPEVKFPSPVAPEGTTVSMTVTAGPGSKTDISETGAITWSTGDKLYVGDGTKYVGYLTITSGVGTPTGTFTGDVTLTGASDGEKTFGFFYLGSDNSVAPAVGATSVDVLFNEQNIYKNGGKLENAKKFHIGYGSAKGTVTDGVVTGINVTLVSKVALARFSFKKGDAAYDGALTLSGDNIYSSMTVGFNGEFNGKDKGTISLTGGHGERYVMLVPTGATTAQTLTFTGSSESGTGDVPGLESNKFYGKTEPIPVTLTAPAPTHEYVDLGLPSGLLWATCNLGASKPEDYGDYYQWGGVTPVTSTDINVGWAGCPFTNDTFDPDNKKVFTKYIPTGKSEYWAGDGDPDNKLALESVDDAATANWGSGWRMPTTEEWEALYDNTTNAWTGDYNGTGVAGRVFTSTDGNGTTLFLPAAGYRTESSLNYAGYCGLYWSSSLVSAVPDRAYGVSFDSYAVYPPDYSSRYYGSTVRPVRPAR